MGLVDIILDEEMMEDIQEFSKLSEVEQDELLEQAINDAESC